MFLRFLTGIAVCLLALQTAAGSTSPSCAPTALPSLTFRPTYTPVAAPNLYYITHYAGSGSSSYSGDGGKATAAGISNVHGCFRNSLGVFYLADVDARIRSIDANDIITTVVGTGSSSYGGDGGPATSGKLDAPSAVWATTTDVMYIPTKSDYRIRKVSGGIISTFAGTGTLSSSATDTNGDGGQATAATMGNCWDLMGDSIGNVYFLDNTNYKLRKVDTSGIITTVAGTGNHAYTADGAYATAATLNSANRFFVDSSGNLFISESGRIRTVSGSTQIITTKIGTGSSSYNGDGLPGTSTKVNAPFGPWGDSTGRLFWCDSNSYVIRMLDITGLAYTIAGIAWSSGNTGNDGYATSATFSEPENIMGDSSGNIWITDVTDNVVRKLTIQVPTWAPTLPPTVLPTVVPTCVPTASPTVQPSAFPSVVPTLPPSMSPSMAPSYSMKPSYAPVVSPRLYSIDLYAGTGSTSHSGDGGKASAAGIRYVHGLCLDSSGNFYLADHQSRVRSVDANNIITTAVGTSTGSYGGDGGPASSATLKAPTDVWFTTVGVLFITSDSDYRIRKVSGGIISTFAGTGTASSSATASNGDGGSATAATITNADDVCSDSVGNIYFTDNTNNKVRVVNPAGIISTVAGTGSDTYSGDGGQATAAGIDDLAGVFVDSVGNVYMTNYARIRMIASSTQSITTVIGTGSTGYNGDGLRATSTKIREPYGVWGDINGQVFYVESDNYLVRMMDTVGIVYNIAGTATTAGNTGNGGYATAATFDQPEYIVGDAAGNIWVSDKTDYVVRKLTNIPIPSSAPTSRTPTVVPTSVLPTFPPSFPPSFPPTILPTVVPTCVPTVLPIVQPTTFPSMVSSLVPSSSQPTVGPTPQPVESPTVHPSQVPSVVPTDSPNVVAAFAPSVAPSEGSGSAAGFSTTVIIGIAIAGFVFLLLLVVLWRLHVISTFKDKGKHTSVHPDVESGVAGHAEAHHFIPTAEIIPHDGVERESPIKQTREASGAGSERSEPKLSRSYTPVSAVRESTSNRLDDFKSRFDVKRDVLDCLMRKDVALTTLPEELHIRLQGKFKEDFVPFDGIAAHIMKLTDTFLTHDWGVNQENHKKVSEINDMLKQRGVVTWFDGEKMHGIIQGSMKEGIDNTMCVVVFITEAYVKKVTYGNDNDNCRMEYRYAARKEINMFPVVMSDKCSNPNNWGELDFKLGGTLYVDMTTIDPERVDKLVEEVFRNKTPLKELVAVWLKNLVQTVVNQSHCNEVE